MLRALLCFCLILFLSVETSLADDSRQYPNVTTADGTIPKYDCRNETKEFCGAGICLDDGTCFCSVVYWNNPIKCDWLVTENDGARRNLITYRILGMVLYTIIALLTLWRLLFGFFANDDAQKSAAPMKNVTKYALVVLFLICSLGAVLSSDFYGAFGVMSDPAWFAIFIAQDVLFPFLFCAILFHWIEIYQVSVSKMKTQQMMEKINSRYTGTVTVEEILIQVSFLKRFRIPFVFLSFLFLSVGVIGAVTLYVSTSAKVIGAIIVFYTVTFFLIYVLFVIGFVLYGYKLKSIMPEALKGKINQLTFSIGGISVILAVSKLIQISTLNSTVAYTLLPQVWTGLYLIFLLLNIIVCLIAVNVYMPFRKWRNWLNPSSLLKSSFGRGSSVTGSKGEEKSSDPLEENELKDEPDV